MNVSYPGQRRTCLAATALCLFVNGSTLPWTGSARALPQTGLELTAETLDERIIVRVGGRTFTCYRYGDGQKYPYFYPVNGPTSGRSLTTESSLPYPHHRSLFFGCDKVNLGNYWQEGNERGQIVSKGPNVIHHGPDYVRILDQCEWRQPAQAPIALDSRDIRISAPTDRVRFIDFDIALTAQTDIQIENTNHSLFAVRVDPELSVNAGGTLRNAEGAMGEKATFGISSSWCDFSATRCGVTEGIAIFDSPRNPWFPGKWFTRDYGFMSPTPMYWLGEEGYRLKSGETLRLSYRVVVHVGDVQQANLQGLFMDWSRQSQP